MILSDVTLSEYLDAGKVRVSPPVNPRDIRPVGIRVHLAERLMVPGPPQRVDLRLAPTPAYSTVAMDASGFVLQPGAFVIGATRERIQATVPLVGLLDGRSTLARLGLMIHAGSIIIDGNHDEPRSIVLEMKNVGPFDILLSPGLPIAMVTFAALSAPIAQASQIQYRVQHGVTAPNLADDAASRGTDDALSYERIAVDVADYAQRTRTDPVCFICAFLDGDTRYHHHEVWRDECCVAFLDKYPTMPGKLLVAPIRHVSHVVTDFSLDEYLHLQRRLHMIGRALTETVPTARLYVYSFGASDGHTHLHWHLAALPPGVPYDKQQFHAVMMENGIVRTDDDEMAALAARIRSKLTPA